MANIPVKKFSQILATHPIILLSSRSGRSNSISPLTRYLPLSDDPPLIGISLKPSSSSYHYIRESGDFILAVPNKTHLKVVHFCGVHTGRDTDKVFHSNLPTSRAKSVSPLLLTSCMANIECKVRDIFRSGNRPFICGEILTITADSYYYDQDWLPTADLIYYNGGNTYRMRDKIIDMSPIRPGYIPPGTVIG
jgi:flavin reductase (DIM6/NTAB) family NADH-FMN oxidoreductase RutF